MIKKSVDEILVIDDLSTQNSVQQRSVAPLSLPSSVRRLITVPMTSGEDHPVVSNEGILGRLGGFQCSVVSHESTFPVRAHDFFDQQFCARAGFFSRPKPDDDGFEDEEYDGAVFEQKMEDENDGEHDSDECVERIAG